MTDQRDAAGRPPPSTEPARADYKTFFEELRRRRVIRVGLVYLVAAWLIIQVAQATFPALLLPGWSVTLVVILVALGFPIALILSWAYQVSAEGTDHSATTVHYIVDRNRKIDFAIIAALAVVVVILAYERFALERPATAPGTGTPAAGAIERPSIAVLPFANLSGDPQNTYFSDGLTEEILNLLVRMKAIDVAARTSSFYFRGKDVDIKMVADQLGVTNVLEGSVRREGEKVRVTAQLIKAGTGFHLWSNTYDREMKDILSIQDDIARQVVDALEIVLSSESQAILDRSPTSSVEAYEHYLRGRDYLRDEHSEARLQSALLQFGRAVDLDPNYAEAHAGLCDTLLALYRKSRSTEYFESAERACNRGLELDSIAGDVYVALGNLYHHSGQYDRALGELRKALAINDKNVEAYTGIAESYLAQNMYELAEQNFRQAIEIQPAYWRVHVSMGNFLYTSGRIAEAMQAYRRAVELAPDNSTAYNNLGSSYYLLGDFENAAAAWNKSLALAPSTSAYMNLGSSYFFLGRFSDAASMYRTASELSPDDYEVWGSLGDALNQAGGADETARESYRKAIELGEKMLAINASDARLMAALSQYHARLGNTERAMQLVAQAKVLQPQNMYVHYFSAVTYAATGNNEAALDALGTAVDLGYPVALLAVDAGLSAVAADERFQRLVAGDAG